MIERALQKAGGVEYLARQAEQNPVAFMGLVGRVLPLQLAGHDGQRLVVDFRWADATIVDTAPVDTPVIDAVADETTDNDAPAISFIGDC